MFDLVYYSSASGNTACFVRKLGLQARALPLAPDQPPLRPFVLICPTYADGTGRGAVPKPVIRFLNDPTKRALLRGVIGAGNRNFGQTYALGARIIAEKCQVPLLYRFELAGTENDLIRVARGLAQFWESQCSINP